MCSFTSEISVQKKDPYIKFKIPQQDPRVDPAWCYEKFDILELGAHMLKLSVDMVTKNTAEIWSEMAGRDVTIKEKLVGVHRTQAEMLALRRQYEDKRKKSSLRGVSTTVASNETECFSLILSKVPLPNLIFAISVESGKTMSNNMFKGLLDTGSQCSILTMDTVEKSGLSAHVKKCTVSITLTGATGCQKHPFKGELTVNVRFLCSNYRFSQHVKQKFFVSSSIK